jgi:hypothetical protein
VKDRKLVVYKKLRKSDPEIFFRDEEYMIVDTKIYCSLPMQITLHIDKNSAALNIFFK